jgi:hypothetical protein
MTKNYKRGFVYVASGHTKFIDEASESAKSCREFHDLPICLITDLEFDNSYGFWDVVVKIPQNINPYFGKTQMFLSPFEENLFLDTDTLFISSVDELFDLFNYCSLFVHQMGDGYEYSMPPFNDATPEFNTGVIGFKKDQDSISFFQEWERNQLELGESFRSYDQCSFRKTLYNSKIRYCWIPSAYNFIIYYPNYTVLPVKILHGRPMSKLISIAQYINKIDYRGTMWHRAFLPNMDLVILDSMSYYRLWKLIKISTFTLIKKFLTDGKKKISSAK